MNNDESSDTGDSALFWVTLEFVVISSILPVLFLDRCSRKPNRSPNAKRTKYLMIGVFFSNILFQLISLFRHTACIHCTLMSVALIVSRSVVREMNLIFFIHRAKLVQGMSPVSSKKWFERILPISVTVIIFGFIVVGTKSTIGSQYECNPYPDWNVFHRCSYAKTSSGTGIALWFAISLDTIITSGLMVLFIIPLYRVYNADIGVMNENQMRQRMKLRNLLIWSVLLTFTNQVTTAMYFVQLVVDQDGESLFLWVLGKFDPSINVWSSWLIVARNRQFVKQMCCCKMSAVPQRHTLALISEDHSRTVELSDRDINAAPQRTQQQPIELQLPANWG